MQPDHNTLVNKSARHPALRVAAKEISLFFASPIAYLFLGAFAAITLFVFFWGEAFFARNIADVRPLFEWMPLLLIFLSATLTMRLWSDERRTGTLEHVLTQSVPLWHFVVGKFLSCLFLLVLALAITLPLPITVALLGDLDWGPVWAGYLATLALGAAYISIGLFVSARSDNQIVSLIIASALCGVLYLLGHPVLTNLFGHATAEWLAALGTGTRFDAITRGVIDLRDFYYYLSIMAVFLTLNTLVLERERWVQHARNSQHRRWQFVAGLLIANALGANLWLGQITALRVDVTQGQMYSLSDATDNYLQQLQEPLLIRGYFSNKTHPLLAPLVPQMRDLMREYEIAGQGQVRVEFIDPLANPELEQEANQKYAITPVPFQVADRYQSSIVSSYFNVLVQYGDEHQVLGFRDLIEVQARSESDLNVQLRNPEHDLTRAIKKVLQSYQAGGNLFDTVKSELTFTAYLSPSEKLPPQLATFRETVEAQLTQYQAQAKGRLRVRWENPEANGGELGRQIAEDYGLRPMATSLLSNESFYFYLTLTNGEQLVQLPLEDLSEASFKRNLEAGIKRFATGFTKTVALVAPENGYSPYGSPRTSFHQLEQFLSADLNIQREDLTDGSVSGEADVLMLLAPENLDEKSLFAVDQFLMQGGTVIAATSPFSASLSNRSLSLQDVNSGLESWLKHHGIHIEKQLVLDPQNTAFPVPVTRNLGGFQIQDMRLIDYPYFPDLRADEINQVHPMTRALGQLTLAWASPITVTESQERTVTELLHSSGSAGLSSARNIMPQLTEQGLTPMQPEQDIGRHLLGVVSEGRFESYFKDKPSPLIEASEAAAESDAAKDASTEAATSSPFSRVISHSPEAARIILFASNDFLSDQVVRLTGSAQQGEYLAGLQLANNAIDWALEDAGLTSIRSRGHFNRTLPPLSQNTQMFWEYLNYVLAALALALIALLAHYHKRAKAQRYSAWLAH
ncbi:Gldg family protein [Simiduia sp. 21SJ11W-1]|uniref:Gldg family protein n=1 Tax=Simiduia sp. 21SJ11W-1 TaxID=2909669 RepID=UPI0020A1F92F|nr:Gldg family protein [Simiduia sp. 21SJ11W-1]UTA47048.1 Gldg family protein [Simiduia sp. 21SJ11W-1]